MKKNKTIFTLLAVFASTAVLASNPADDDNMYVITNQSTVSAVYSLEDVDKITFTEKGINIWKPGWSTEYDYGNFRMITFSHSNSPSAINQTMVNEDKVTINYSRQKDLVIVKSDKPLAGVIVYDVQGRSVANADNMANDYEISISSAPRGIYIVKVKGNAASKKIAK